MKTGRIILGGTLNLLSPLMIGSGRDDISDRDVLVDSEGIVFIPATSFLGVLKTYFNVDIDKDYLGLYLSEPVNQSFLICDDLYPCSSKGNCRIRDGIRIDNSEGIVEDKAKFDYQVVEPGLNFTFRLEFVINNENRYIQAQHILEECLGVFEHSFFLGGKRSSGFGKLKAGNLYVNEYDFDTASGLTQYLLELQSSNNIENYKPKFSTYDTFVIKADFHLKNSLIVRTYPEDVYGPDAVHISSQGKPILPATSVRGVLRAQAERILYTIWQDVDFIEDFVSSMFGTAVTKNKKYTIPSALYVNEVPISNVTTELQNRICIDRFTGGTIEGALFDSMPVFPQDSKTENITHLTLRLEHPLPSQKGLLILLLKDLYTGDLAIGGEKNIGRGTLQGLKATIFDQNKKNSISQITELPDNFTPYLEALIKNSDKDQIQNNLAIYKDKGGKVNE